MKRFLLLVVIVVFSGCSGGMTRIPDSERVIRVKSEIPGQEQLELFGDSKSWMEKNFISVKGPIVFEDIQEGTVTGHGQLDYPCSWLSCLTKSDYKVLFAMKVDARQGMIMTTFHNIELSSQPDFDTTEFGRGMTSPVWSRRDMDAIRPLLLKMNQDLVRYLRSSSP